jgi:hypothetical protein
MERIPRPDLNNNPPADAEPFQVNGKPVRTMTDTELKTLIDGMKNEMMAADQQFQHAWQQTCNVRGILQVLAYETERRKRALLIATGLPRSN